MDQITAADALLLMEQVVAEKGDSYVYDSEGNGGRCVYFARDTGAPACLVGHALDLAGFGIEDLGTTEVEQWIANAHSANQLPIWTSDRITVDAAAVFRAAQRRQDRGKTWGVALVAAKDEFNELEQTAPQPEGTA